MILATFLWDPNPALFNFVLPILHRPILWYGFLFALAFFVGALLFVLLLQRVYKARSLHVEPRKEARRVADALVPYVLLGAIIGGRLLDVLCYQEWSHVWKHPFSIVQVWNGGLASHGGAVGILVGLWLFVRRYGKTFGLSVLSCLDLLSIPASFAAILIRIGNFINQEIVGTITSLPWGVHFLHAIDGSSIEARHPVQLYEAFFYLLLFGFLLRMFRSQPVLSHPGKMFGWFLLLSFCARFLFEYVKVEQSMWWDESHFLTMGQMLSLPFLGAGILLLNSKSYVQL
jgi:phosphatidylglycerol---prolipoprotein diacylglyceryl transferase